MKTLSISEFCKTGSGGTPSRSKQALYYDGGTIPWVKSGELAQSIVESAKEFITEQGLAESSTKLLQPGAILIAMYGATVGQVSRLAIPASTNQAICHIYPDQKICEPDYLYRVLKGAKDTLLARRVGGGQPNISQKIVRSLQIPLPPLTEQKRIAKILDATDALRAKRREALAQLDTLLQSTFLKMFGDPVINPKEFPICTLSDLYIDKKNGTKCGPFGSALKKAELVDSGVPVWNMDNIDPAGRMVLPFRMWITEDKHQQLEAYSVIDGDVIISRAGTVGKMCVANPGCTKSIISTNLIRVRFGADLLPVYFVSLMTYCKGRVGRLKTGPDGAFTHMSTGVLDKLKFPLPPLPLQTKFAAIVKSVEQQKARMQTHLSELDTLFAALQQRAFNGNL